jgi:hypothetical protein
MSDIWQPMTRLKAPIGNKGQSGPPGFEFSGSGDQIGGYLIM